jgi:hypothetical protein
MSTVKKESSYLVSTDIGTVRVHLQDVESYDVEDIVRDRAISQARAVQMLQLGKQIDATKPTAARTLKSAWLNNDEELLP